MSRSGQGSRVILVLFVVSKTSTCAYRKSNRAAACLPSLRPLLNLALFGSVERPSRVRGSNEKLSGSLSGKLSSVWSSHLPSFHFDTHRSSSSRDEDDSRAFVRAADDRFRAFNRTHVGVSDGSLNNAIKDGEIGVRTDVFVHNQV